MQFYSPNLKHDPRTNRQRISKQELIDTDQSFQDGVMFQTMRPEDPGALITLPMIQ